MAQKFRSLRQKLVLKMGLTYFFALLFVFLLIIVTNALEFNESVAATEVRFKAALVNKGQLLVENNSHALVGMVEDNAFSAVEHIVSRTVKSGEGVVYGVFSDIEGNDWAYIFKHESLEKFKSEVDQNSSWAMSQQQPAAKPLLFDGTEVIEFAAPILVDGVHLGTIRYGLSTAALREAIDSANQLARAALFKTLVALLGISIITLLIAYWRTTRVAKQITVPLNELTKAADIITGGEYGHKINISTNDEIGLLADNFALMTDTINRKIDDLAAINRIGRLLSQTREEEHTLYAVLTGIIEQLGFQGGMLFDYDGTGALRVLSESSITPETRPFITEEIDKYGEKPSFDRHEEKSVLGLYGDKPALGSYGENPALGSHEQANKNLVQFKLPDSCSPYKSIALMAFGERAYSIIYLALLSDTEGRELEVSETEFCQSIRQLLVTSLENISMDELLAEQNRTLEDKVAQRTAELNNQNNALNEALIELEQAQNQLIESEKMASLGSLVAGISHEVNTPIGVSVTAASHLKEATVRYNKQVEEGALTKSGFLAYLESASEASDIILSNLNRAVTLVKSFKQIAVDQSVDTKTDFNVKQHLEMLITSLKPTYKKRPVSICLEGDDDIVIHNYPGFLSQVVTNLVMNSFIHAFVGIDKGGINIIIQQDEDNVLVAVEDDGVGIPDENKGKVFDPFYTTTRGSGGSGLGLNIVYNLVKQKLGGSITVSDKQPRGTRFQIRIPK